MIPAWCSLSLFHGYFYTQLAPLIPTFILCIAMLYLLRVHLSTGLSCWSIQRIKDYNVLQVRPDTQSAPPGETADSVPVCPLVRCVCPPLPPVALSSASCRPTGGVSPLRPERSATDASAGKATRLLHRNKSTSLCSSGDSSLLRLYLG